MDKTLKNLHRKHRAEKENLLRRNMEGVIWWVNNGSHGNWCKIRSHEEVNCYTVGSVTEVGDWVLVLLCMVKNTPEVLARAVFVVKDFF